MRLVWYLWPVNLILGAILSVALLAGVWLLGHHLRTLFQSRQDGLRMRDLIALNLQIEEIETGVRHFCDRQEKMLEQLQEMVSMAHHTRPNQDETREPR